MEAALQPRLSRSWTAILTGYACNNRCIFCAQGALRTATVKAAAQSGELIRLGRGPRVLFLGGEPTLLDDLPARVANERGNERSAQRVVIQTNARRLAYKAYTAELAGAGVDALDISLQGPAAAIHDHHTRSPGSFAQTVAGAMAALKLGLEVGLTTVITRSNHRHLVELVRRAAELGVRRLHMSPALGLGEARRLLPRVLPRRESLIPHLEAAAREAARLGLDLRASGLRQADPVYLAYHGEAGELPWASLPGPLDDDDDLFAGVGWTEAEVEEAPGG